MRLCRLIVVFLCFALFALGCESDSSLPRSNEVSRNGTEGRRGRTIAAQLDFVSTDNAGVRGQTGDEVRPQHFQVGNQQSNLLLDEANPVGHLPYHFTEPLFQALVDSEPGYVNWGSMIFQSVPASFQVGQPGDTGSAEITLDVETPPEVTFVNLFDASGQLTRVEPPVRVRLSYSRSDPNGPAEIMATVNDQEVDSSAVIGGSDLRIKLTVSAVSGTYLVNSTSQDASGSNEASDEIPVRTLVFDEEFAPIVVPSGGTARFANSFQWDLGPPELEEPEWTIRIASVFGSQIEVLTGTGNTIDAEFDPSVLAQGVSDREVILLPEGSIPAKIVRQQALERAMNPQVRAQQSGPIYLTYVVFGSARALLPFGEPRHYAGSVETAEPAARVADFEFTTPPGEYPSPLNVPPESRAEASLTGAIELFGFDIPPTHELIIYGEDGTVLKSFPSSGEEFIDLLWDGYDQTGNPIEPQVVRVVVRFCGGSPDPQFRQVLAQGPGDPPMPSCTENTFRVAINVTLGTELVITVDPPHIPPSDLRPGTGQSTAKVKVELVEMPPDVDEVEVTLEGESVDIGDPELNLQLKGGHNHDANRPATTLRDTRFVFTAPGVRETIYTATIAGGAERIVGLVDGEVAASATIDVRVEGLGRLLPHAENSTLTGYVLNGGAGPDNQISDEYPNVFNHPNNHWGTPEMLAALTNVSSKYMAKHVIPDQEPTRVQKLIINDISLPRGGVFDVGNNWAGPHHEHREGDIADIYPGAKDFELFKQLWTEETGGTVYDEGDHVHVRLP